MKTHRLELNTKYIDDIMEVFLEELKEFFKTIDLDIEIQYIIDTQINTINGKKEEHQVVKLIGLADFLEDGMSVRISTFMPEDIETIKYEELGKTHYYKTIILQSIIDRSDKEYILNHHILSEDKYKKSGIEELKNIKI